MNTEDRSVRIALEAMLADVAEGARPDGRRALLVFETADEVFAVDATAVERIVARPFIAPLPVRLGDAFGIASIQGRMRLVMDPTGVGAGNAARVIVLHGDGHLALVADHVVGVRIVDDDAVDRALGDGVGVGRILDEHRPVRVLDVERMLAGGQWTPDSG